MSEKDLTYSGRVKQRQQNAEAVKAVVDGEVAKANDFLKVQGVKVKLIRCASSIQLAATLPVKLGDTPTSSKGTKQYRITHLKCFASLDGVKKAIKEAIYLDDLVKSSRFTWDEYLPKEQTIAKPKTWREVVELFEQNYWVTHAKTRKTLNTWDKSYSDLFKKLDLDACVSKASIIDAIKKTVANTVTRHHLIRVLKALCKFIEFKFDFSSYSASLSKVQRKERKIPTDDEIILTWKTLPDDTKWTFGMIATYGLRPEEIFINPHIQEYIDPSNTIHIFHVDRDCKTGERKVLPLKPEWVDLFKLKEPQPLKSNAKKLEHTISWVNRKFRISPYWNRGAYDLRHSYAIRGHKYGIPVADMARYMGHDIETHVKEYQRWIGIDTMIEVYLEATGIHHKSRKTLIAENAVLALDNENLKQENDKLKQKLAELEMKFRLMNELHFS
jgi:integrase